MRLARLPLLLVVAAFCACEGKIDPLADVEVIPANQSVAAAIGPAGGVVELESTDGARIRLAVPPGALDSTVTITIRTVEATPAQRFQVRFEPDGLVFDGPASVEVTLAEGNELAASGALQYDGVPLASDRLPSGAWQAAIRGFAVTRLFGNAEPMPPLPGAQTTPAPPPCTGWSDDSRFIPVTLSAHDEFERGTYSLCALMRTWALREVPTHANAMRLANASDAFLTRAADALPTALTNLRQETCTALGEALAALEAAPLTAYGQNLPPILRVLYWMQQAHRVEAPCTALPAAQVAVDGAAHEAAAFHDSRVGLITSVTSAEYGDAVREAVEARMILVKLRSLDASLAVRQLALQLVSGVIHPAQLATVLPAASAHCDATGSTVELDRLVRAMGAVPALLSAIEACGPG